MSQLTAEELAIMDLAEQRIAECTCNHCPEIVELARSLADKMRVTYADVDDVTIGRIVLGTGTSLSVVPSYDVKRQGQLMILTACELTRMERDDLRARPS